ncbi:MAG: hypothetical protein WCO66_03645 [Candidatus Absconditabacteria bacterium]
MNVYQKIAWLQFNNDDFSLRRVFGKEKLKYLEQGKQSLLDEGFSYGIEPLTEKNLQDFFVLYSEYISTKHNPNVHDLLALYGERIAAGEAIFLGYVRKGDSLLGGAIFIHKPVRGKNGLVLGFRAFSSVIFNKLSIGYYLEYLYFSFGLELGVHVFSRGSDRNGYGALGSNVGLAIHKVQLWFTPHVPSIDLSRLEIDETTIHDETIFFSQSDENTSQLDIVTIWTKYSPEEAEKAYGIFAKRGLITNYFYLS